MFCLFFYYYYYLIQFFTRFMVCTFSLLIIAYISIVQSLSIYHPGSCFIFNFLIEYLSFTPWTFYILTCIHLFYFRLLTLDNFLLLPLLTYFNSRFSNLHPIVSVFLLTLHRFPFSSFFLFLLNSSLIYLYDLFDFPIDYQIVSFHFQIFAPSFSLIFFLLSDRSVLRSFSLLSVHPIFSFWYFLFFQYLQPVFSKFYHFLLLIFSSFLSRFICTFAFFLTFRHSFLLSFLLFVIFHPFAFISRHKRPAAQFPNPYTFECSINVQFLRLSRQNEFWSIHQDLH